MLSSEQIVVRLISKQKVYGTENHIGNLIQRGTSETALNLSFHRHVSCIHIFLYISFSFRLSYVVYVYYACHMGRKDLLSKPKKPNKLQKVDDTIKY